MTPTQGLSHFVRRRLPGVVLAVALIVAAASAALAMSSGASSSTTDLGVWKMATGLLGGLALFLFGIEQLSDALKALAANRLKDILARLTTNRFTAAATGALVTAIIQSSSVTTVLVVGFISAGILSVSQSVGIIFGANIGSTVTAQVVAFKATELALPLVTIGFAMLFVSKRDRGRQYGAMIMGLGMLFYGMGLMNTAMKPLRSFTPFLDLMAQMENPLLGILVAAIFTGLIQSSSAATGVVIALASQGLITLPAGIALVFGANVGTCVTAMLASMGKPRPAIRAGMVHVLFNIAGVLLWVGLIDYLAAFVTWLSPAEAGLSGLDKLAAETPRQIANAHTVFNVANTFIFLPFGALFARLVEAMVPEGADDKAVTTTTAGEWTAVHLDPGILAVPSVALEQTRGELARLARLIEGMVCDIMPSFQQGDVSRADRIFEQTEEAEGIAIQIDEYLIQVSRRNLSQEQSEYTSQLQDVGTDLTHINSLLRRFVVPLLRRRAETDVVLPEPLTEALTTYYDCVCGVLSTVIEAVAENRAELARDVVRAEPEIRQQLTRYRPLHHEYMPVTDEQPGAGIDLDLLDYIRRIYMYSEDMAYTVLHGYLDQRGGARKRKI